MTAPNRISLLATDPAADDRIRECLTADVALLTARHAYPKDSVGIIVARVWLLTGASYQYLRARASWLRMFEAERNQQPPGE
jgi:hypothetical protein